MDASKFKLMTTEFVNDVNTELHKLRGVEQRV